MIEETTFPRETETGTLRIRIVRPGRQRVEWRASRCFYRMDERLDPRFEKTNL